MRAIEKRTGTGSVTVEVVVVDDRSADADAPRSLAAIPESRVRLIALRSQPQVGRRAQCRHRRGRAACGSPSSIGRHGPGGPAQGMIERATRRGADRRRQFDVVSLTGASQDVSEADLAPAAAAHASRLHRIQRALSIPSHNFGYMKPISSARVLENQQLRFDETLRIGRTTSCCIGACLWRALRGRASAGYIYHIREGSISRVLRPRSYRRDDRRRRSLPAPLRAVDGPGAENAAQAHARLPEARSFLVLVEQLKKRSLAGALKTALADPLALRHLQHADRCPIAPPCRAIRASLLPIRPPVPPP